MPVVKKHSAQRQSQAIPHCTHFAAATLAQKKTRRYSHVSVHACVHVVCVYAAVDTFIHHLRTKGCHIQTALPSCP
jgi:hypothetical protein